MSRSDSPEAEAFRELEAVVRRVEEEVASWRRRALKAEADRAELGQDHDAVGARERIQALERDNADLDTRLEAARERVRQLADRLRFLEDQVALEDTAG